MGGNHIPGFQEAYANAEKDNNTVGSSVRARVGVTLKGTVVRFERVNPHSFLYIDVKDKDGDTQLWTIEGPNVTQLSRMAFRIDALKAGDAVEACGYLPKEGRYRHYLTGELLTLPDGRKEKWLDYGHHKCLGPDYQDQHSGQR